MVVMLLRFLGGAQEVGRSAVLLEDGKQLLLDYGVKLDHKLEYPIAIPKVDIAVLSHAHFDHCGFFPALYNKSFPPTIGTAPTSKLSSLLIDDSMSIARKEHEPEHFHKRQTSNVPSTQVGPPTASERIRFQSGSCSRGETITLVMPISRANWTRVGAPGFRARFDRSARGPRLARLQKPNRWRASTPASAPRDPGVRVR